MPAKRLPCEPRVEVYLEADACATVNWSEQARQYPVQEGYTLEVSWREDHGVTTAYRYGYRTRWWPRILGEIYWALNVGRRHG